MKHCLLFSFFCLLTIQLSGQTAAYSILSVAMPQNQNGTQRTAGFSFSPTKTITVTDLGFIDVGLDGLLLSHLVGLWTDSGTLLESTEISAGTSAPLIGDHRYNSIDPVELTAGTTYIVAATTNTSASSPTDTEYSVGAEPEIQFIDDITYVSRRSSSSNSNGVLVFPDRSLENSLGSTFANFLFTDNIAVIPEASNFGFLTSLVLFFSLIARRKQVWMK